MGGELMGAWLRPPALIVGRCQPPDTRSRPVWRTIGDRAGETAPADPLGGRPPMPIQEAGEKVIANVERVIVGKHEEVRLALVALLCQGHLLIEDVPGHRQDRARQGHRPEPGLHLPAHPVHARPAALGRHRPLDLQPEDPGVRVPAGPDHGPDRARRRDQPGDAQDAVGAARVHGGAPGDGRRHDLPDAVAVPGHRHPEPDRVRGHLRAARGAARPLHAPPPAGLSGAARGDRHPRRAEARPPARGAGEAASLEELQAAQSAVREVYVDSTISDYIVRLVNATRTHPDVYLGASPRGSLALYRAGQAYRRAARPRLRHPRRRQGRRRAGARPSPDHADRGHHPRRRAGHHRARAARVGAHRGGAPGTDRSGVRPA